jgi:hypothetical protein
VIDMPRMKPMRSMHSPWTSNGSQAASIGRHESKHEQSGDEPHRAQSEHAFNRPAYPVGHAKDPIVGCEIASLQCVHRYTVDDLASV